MARGGKMQARLARWVDEWRMAASGVVLAMHDWKFDVVVVATFVVFGTLMNLLSSSTAALNLFWVTDWGGKLSIIKDSFLAIFGVGRNLTDFLLIFCITLLQSILIGLVVFVWRKKKHNADNLQSAGLAAGLAVLGSGCPTCGTTLLMPLIGTVFSSGGYMIAGAISGILTVAAIWLALFTLRRIGKEAYVMIKSELYMQRHAEAKEE